MDQNAVYNSLWAKYQLKNGKEVYRRYVIDIANEQVQYLLAPLGLVFCLEGFTRMDPFAALWWMIHYPLAMLFSFGLLQL